MPRCPAMPACMRRLASSTVGLANQMLIETSVLACGAAARCEAGLLAVFLADAPIGFAERNALAGHERVGFFGGVNRGVEFDRLGPETHALDSYRHDGRRAQ